MSPSVQNLGWLFDIGDEILPNYMGIIRSQYKDPIYKTISIMEGHVWVLFTLLNWTLALEAGYMR